MKVKNTAIYAGQDPRALRRQQEKDAKAQSNRKSILASTLNGQGDKILMRKKQAQKQALKIVGDTFAGDKKLDESQEEIRQNHRDLMKQYNDLKKEMAERFPDDMPEEEMTPEMLEERQDAMREYQRQLDSLERQMEFADSSLRRSKIARLESSPMLEAQEQADEIMQAASEDIQGMLWQEAKDHIDEEQKKREEQAEKLAEQKEEQEELLEKAKENREEQEELIEVLQEKTDVDDLQKELDDMLEKMKLIEEDLKGTTVDAKL